MSDTSVPDLTALRAQIENQFRVNDTHFHQKAADKVIPALTWYSPLAWSTPTNIASLRHAVTESVTTGSPLRVTAEYDQPIPDDILRAADDVDRATELIRNHFAADELHRKSADMRGLARAISSGLDADYADWSRHVNGLPSGILRDHAQSLWSTPVQSDADADPATVTDHAMSAMLRAALALYGLTGWRIDIVDMSAKVLVDGLNRLIKVQQGLQIGPRYATRLVAHEIGRHVLSIENARCQPDPFAQLSLGEHHVATEEGAATWLETELTGMENSDRRQLFAARVMAVEWAQEVGVVELADRLSEQLPLSEAVTLAVRVKRGLRDLNAPGGMTKDYMYLAGLLEIEQRTQSQPDILELLQLTKWSIARLSEVEWRLSDGRLVPARYRLDDLRDALSSGSLLGAGQQGGALREAGSGRRWLRRGTKTSSSD